MAPVPEPREPDPRADDRPIGGEIRAEIRTELGHLSGVIRAELYRLGRQISSEIDVAAYRLSNAIETQHRRSIGRLLAVNAAALFLSSIVLAFAFQLVTR